MGKCYNQAIINKPIETVWATIRDFHHMEWAKEVVETTEKVGTCDGTTVGAQRILNQAFFETLLTLDDKEHSFTYRIDDGPGPIAKVAVNNYIGSVKATPIEAEGRTMVEWSSTFEANDEDAVGDFCNPIYQGLLHSLQENI